MRTPLLSIRVDADTKQRWQARADAAGLTLSEFIRACVDEGRPATLETGKLSAGLLDASGEVVGAPMLERSHPKKTRASAGKARTETCEHRRKPDEYCSRCDE